ncbi:hypothetical protein [Nocardia salmonicida]|uniref:hypothetical protein n=1 Tax=Nocardia salmonicida TaxID=53431 RepID=UPI0007A55BAF|nr:hypothetical protein [Nocardia salmonicida]
MNGRHIVIAVYPLTLHQPPIWPAGPLPVEINNPARPFVADLERRQTYYPARTARLLYGTPDAPRRWHKLLNQVVGNVEILAAEILLPHRGDTGLLIIHIEGREVTALEIVRSLARRWPDSLALRPDRCLNEPDMGVNDVVPYTITFLTGRSLPRLYRHPRYVRWPAADQWLWALASRTGPTDHPPDPKRDNLGTVRLSSDWSALVLRDGTSFVGQRSDHGSDDPFFAAAHGYVRSIYLDAILIGQLQLHGISALEDQLAHIPAVPSDAHLNEVEHAVADFRHRVWWQHLTVHGVPNDILTAHHQQHRLRDRFAQILSEVQDGNRLNRETQNLHVSNAALLFSVVTVPLAIAIGALDIAEGGNAWVYVIAGLVVLGVVVAILTTPTGRLLIRTIRRRLGGPPA